MSVLRLKVFSPLKSISVAVKVDYGEYLENGE